MLMKLPKNSAASGGMSTIEMAPCPEQKSAALRLISITSACRVTAKNSSVASVSGLTNSYRVNGPCSRSTAKSAIRSSSGRFQNRGSMTPSGGVVMVAVLPGVDRRWTTLRDQ